MIELELLNKYNLQDAIDIQHDAFDGRWDKYAKDIIPRLIGSNGYFFYVAKNNGKIVGTSGAMHDPIAPNTFGLGWVAILPEFQGKGLGREMLNSFMKKMQQDYCKGENCTFILSADSEEQMFYTKLGFTEGGTIHCGAKIMLKIVK